MDTSSPDAPYDEPPVEAPPDADPLTSAAATSVDVPLGRRTRIDTGRAMTLAAGVAGGLLLATALELTIVRLRSLLIVVIISVFLSFAMEPAVQYLNRRGIRRGFGTAMVFVAALLLVAGFIAAMAPLIIEQVRNLVDSGPDILDGLSDQARNLPGDLGATVAQWLEDARADLDDRAPAFVGRVGGGLVGIGTTLVGAIVQGLTVLLVTFYLVADGPRVRRALVSFLEPQTQYDVLAVWELAVAKTGGYVYSRLLLAVVSGVFHYVVFVFIDLPQAVALAVWVGLIASLVPVIGTYIAGALPLVIALANQPSDAVVVLIAIVVYQQVENYLVAPRVNARAMELHPAIAFLAVLVGGALLGPTGALLALPAAAIAGGVTRAFGERHEPIAHDLLLEVDPDADRRLREQLRARGRTTVSAVGRSVKDVSDDVRDSVRDVADGVKRRGDRS